MQDCDRSITTFFLFSDVEDDAELSAIPGHVSGRKYVEVIPVVAVVDPIWLDKISHDQRIVHGQTILVARYVLTCCISAFDKARS